MRLIVFRFPVLQRCSSDAWFGLHFVYCRSVSVIFPLLFFIIRNTFWLYWLLTKILSVKVSMMLIVINDSYVFDWSLVRLWIPFFKWTETAKMESPFEYKPKTSFLPKRTHSREEVIVKFLVWFGWLGCGRYSLLVFRFLECYFNELRVFF